MTLMSFLVIVGNYSIRILPKLYFTYRFTTCIAFKSLIKEVNDLAGQHEVIAEELQAKVITELTALVKDLKEERKVSLFVLKLKFVDLFFLSSLFNYLD